MRQSIDAERHGSCPVFILRQLRCGDADAVGERLLLPVLGVTVLRGSARRSRGIERCATLVDPGVVLSLPGMPARRRHRRQLERPSSAVTPSVTPALLTLSAKCQKPPVLMARSERFELLTLRFEVGGGGKTPLTSRSVPRAQNPRFRLAFPVNLAYRSLTQGNKP